MMTGFLCVLINADHPNVFQMRNQKRGEQEEAMQSAQWYRSMALSQTSWSHGCSLAQLYWQNTALFTGWLTKQSNPEGLCLN